MEMFITFFLLLESCDNSVALSTHLIPLHGLERSFLGVIYL